MDTLAPASPQVNDVTGPSLSVTGSRAAELSQIPEQEWTRADLAWFVRSEITRMNGPQLPIQQEDQIINEFFDRYGVMGVKIARHAFGFYDGMWRGAPVTVRRFAPGQDVYFAAPILREISA